MVGKPFLCRNPGPPPVGCIGGKEGGFSVFQKKNAKEVGKRNKKKKTGGLALEPQDISRDKKNKNITTMVASPPKAKLPRTDGAHGGKKQSVDNGQNSK